MSDNIDRTITPNPPADFTPSMGNYKTLQPFRYWCQKVLPLVYDDILSYYELLCKVVDYLNKTMEDVETLHGDVTNLHTAYDELQSYVNNYFSTLDVQEEINSKLDNMASNGELYEIIRRYTDPIVNEQNEKIKVLKARMDTFASLPQGSTSGDAELTDIRVGYDGKTYPSAGDAVRGQVSKLNKDLDDLSFTSNQYVPQEKDVVNAIWWTAEQKNALPNEGTYIVYPFKIPAGTYYYKGIYAYFSWILFEDGTSRRLSENISNNHTGKIIIEQKATIKLTISDISIEPSFSNDRYLYLGLVDRYYGEMIYPKVYITPKVQIITVKNDGSGDFVRLKDATDSIKDASKDNPYEIHIYGGNYNIYSELGGQTFYNSIKDTSNNRQGIQIKDYVSLIGHGDVKLEFHPLDSEANIYNTSCCSPLEVYGNSTIENITIEASNCRYCIHDETGGLMYGGATHKYKNVYLHHGGNKEGTWSSTCAIATGMSSMNKYYYENCVFISGNFYGWSLHNNAGEWGNVITLDGCEIHGEADGVSAKLGYYGDNQHDCNVFIKSSSVNHKLQVKAESDSGVNDNVFKIHNFTNINVEVI